MILQLLAQALHYNLKMYKNLIAGVRSFLHKVSVNMSPVSSCSTKTPAQHEHFDIELNRMVWIDLEMTGLDVDKDKILEVACIVTDSDLNVIAEGPDIIIHQPKTILDCMNEWCVNQHGKTGLTEASLNSSVSVTDAEQQLLDFLSKYVTKKASPLAGNSVYMDRIFLKKHMPNVEDYLHYRIIDVSTMKELCRRWNYDVYKTVPKKEFGHRAFNDIKESIEELRFYKSNFCRTGHSS